LTTARAQALAGCAALLALACAAHAAPAPSVAADNAPPAASVDAGQISAPAGPAVGSGQIPASVRPGSVDAGQISSSQPSVAPPAQISSTLASVSAPPPLSTEAQSRDTKASAIRGHDRCDPAAGASAEQPACANILDQKADQFPPPPTADAKVANPDAPASSLVNDIVTGGTGSVVQPPPAKP
jgi:hypothetical protein